MSTLFCADKSRRPPYRLLASEARALLFHRPAWPAPDSMPSGDGRPVLVIPAFLTGDGFTTGLRSFLGRCGFLAYGWELGVNWGPTPRLLDGLERRIVARTGEHGRVALVGISLGGVLARNVAYDRPDLVRHVVTVASPFRLPTASTLEPLVRLFSGRYSRDMDVARMDRKLPLPSTMIYIRNDGVVSPDSCSLDGPEGKVVELGGAHMTLASSPGAALAIVSGLAVGDSVRVPLFEPVVPSSEI